MNRSEQRIPKLRTRGRENRRKLLREAERLLAQSHGDILRFSDVFESAGVSRGSAYRIYIGIDDLMQDLASEWITNFVDFLSEIRPEHAPENWQQLSDFIIEKGTGYWAHTSDTLRVMPRVRSNAPESYKMALRELSLCLAALFERFFLMPEIPNWTGKLSFYTQLCDAVFSDSVRVDNRITDNRMAEAQILCRTYLSFHLPEWIPVRQSAQ
jgi:AcrR family transcriptional regulator